MTTLGQKIREWIDSEYDDMDDFSTDEVLRYIAENSDTWPQVHDGDGHNEDLDLENWGIVSVDDNVLVFTAGGDWQEPKRVVVTFDESLDQFMCEVVGDDYEEGMEEEAFITALGGTKSGDRIMWTVSAAAPVKIDSDECKAAIVEKIKAEYKGIPAVVLDENNWKRTSKKSVGGLTVREFSCTIPTSGTTLNAVVSVGKVMRPGSSVDEDKIMSIEFNT